MDRRDFLKAGFAGTTLFAFSGLTLTIPQRARAASITVELVAEMVTKTLIDGNTVPIWQFTSLSGGPGALGSGLVVRAGDEITVSLVNNLDRGVNFVVPGALANTAACAPGTSQTYTFTAPAPGSYFFCDDVNGLLSRAMGLAGPLVVLPASGASVLYDGGTSFDRQYTLMLHELDSRLNNDIAAGLPFDLNGYEPNYYFVNGLSAPDTANDADTHIAMTLGETVALRFINAGLILNPMHFHGYHVDVATRNRIPETAVIAKDTVPVEAGECVDVLLPVNQAGIFPLHTHYVPGVTANGVYGNGALLTMSAT